MFGNNVTRAQVFNPKPIQNPELLNFTTPDVVGRTQLRVAGLPHDRSNWASGREIAYH